MVPQQHPFGNLTLNDKIPSKRQAALYALAFFLSLYTMWRPASSDILRD